MYGAYWILTSEVVTQAGGKLSFVLDENTFDINHKEIEKYITSRTVGIIPVHLYGQPCYIDEIMKIAKKYNLWVLEDTAQAHFAKYKDRNVGTFGIASTFLFIRKKFRCNG